MSLRTLGLATAHSAAAQGTAADSLSSQPLVGQPGGTATDALGQFRLADLKLGTYSVRAGMLGYKAKNQAVTLAAGETRGLALRIVTTNLNLAEVTVSQHRDPNQPLATISHIDQTLRPLSLVQDLLRLVPGLFIAQHAGGGKAEQIFVRGFDTDHGTDFSVNIDGLPVNMVSHALGQHRQAKGLSATYATATSTAGPPLKTTASGRGATSCSMPCAATPARAIRWAPPCKTYSIPSGKRPNLPPTAACAAKPPRSMRLISRPHAVLFDAECQRVF